MFRTELELNKCDSFHIALDTKIMSIGSCFAQVMGYRLKSYKLQVLNNPFGTTYNPISISDLILKSLQDNVKLNFVQNQEVWYAYELHSEISSINLDDFNFKTEETFRQAKKSLIEANILMITLGSAFAYQLKETKQIVNNCHKMPSILFSKELLTVAQIVESLDEMILKTREVNPNLKIMFSVSPVRHLKDTIVLNNVSKATLLLAAYEICAKHSNCEYFPAYELMMDDLRDYRFYAEDLIHPNSVAENYIWSKFTTSYFDQALTDFTKKWDAIQKSLHHRPFHANTLAYQKHLQQLLIDLLAINSITNVEDEILAVKSKLNIS